MLAPRKLQPQKATAARPRERRAREVVATHQGEGEESQLYGIAELCREFGLTARALRFYEDKGLLTPRRVGATRVYTRRDRARLALILRSKAIGATLAEIKHYLDLYGAQGEGRAAQLKFVVTRTDAAIAELETKRAHLEALLAELRVINSGARAALDGR